MGCVAGSCSPSWPRRRCWPRGRQSRWLSTSAPTPPLVAASAALTLRLIGTGRNAPNVLWLPLTEPALRLLTLTRPAADLVEVRFQADAKEPFAGPLGRGQLTVECHGHLFHFQLSAFGVEEAARMRGSVVGRTTRLSANNSSCFTVVPRDGAGPF